MGKLLKAQVTSGVLFVLHGLWGGVKCKVDSTITTATLVTGIRCIFAFVFKSMFKLFQTAFE